MNFSGRMTKRKTSSVIKFVGMLMLATSASQARAGIRENATTGSAADLGELPPVGWPLGAPLTCSAMTGPLAESLRAAAEKLRSYCNEQNQKMRSEGFKTCSLNECLDSAVTRDGGYDHGTFSLRLSRSTYTGEPVLTLSYTYPFNVSPNGTFPVCFDPISRSQDLLNDEFAMWDFNRFVEFCAARPESRPQNPPS
ncbi:MAG: hypothetical protein RL189_1819 [Pseudomonadota bacterium]|jgi:hypothetical protein